MKPFDEMKAFFDTNSFALEMIEEYNEHTEDGFTPPYLKGKRLTA